MSDDCLALGQLMDGENRWLAPFLGPDRRARQAEQELAEKTRAARACSRVAALRANDRARLMDRRRSACQHAGVQPREGAVTMLLIRRGEGVRCRRRIHLLS